MDQTVFCSESNSIIVWKPFLVLARTCMWELGCRTGVENVHCRPLRAKEGSRKCSNGHWMDEGVMRVLTSVMQVHSRDTWGGGGIACNIFLSVSASAPPEKKF